MSDATGTAPEEWAAWRAFLAAHTQLLSEIDQRLRREHGISQADYATLAAIRDADNKRLRVGELADILGWEKSRASHLVTRMERRGLLSRAPSSEDGRASDIILTTRGTTTLLGAVRDHAADLHGLFFSQMTPAERDVVNDVLVRILENLDGASLRRT